MYLTFDIEANDFLENVSQVWCLVAQDIQTGEIYKYTSQDDEHPTIEEGLEFLLKAEKVIGHNIISYDLEVLNKLYNFKIPFNKVRDTYVTSTLIYAHLKEHDFKVANRNLPPKLFGRHSLEAWGYRLDCHKGDYGKGEQAFDVYTPEMLDYCTQDVILTTKLAKHLSSFKYSAQAIDLEHSVAKIMTMQEAKGVLLDLEATQSLHATLLSRKNEILNQTRSIFGGKKVTLATPENYKITLPTTQGNVEYVEKTKAQLQKKVDAWMKSEMVKYSPEALRKVLNYKGARNFPTKSELYDKIENGNLKEKIELFNPSSRQHIAQALITKYNWQPLEFTPTGQPKVDDEVLEHLTYPEAKLFAEFLMVTKRIGQIADGDNAWLAKVKSDNRIHGRVISNGAVTGRATHSNPNLGQVPNASAPYGPECRSLFIAPKGFKLVGSDADGLELRCLGSYIEPFDGGKYIEAVCKGNKEDKTDIHTINQMLAGLATRDEAKKFIYTWLYGGGNYKIGKTVGVSEDEISFYLGHKDIARKAAYYLRENKLPVDDYNIAMFVKGYILKETFLENNKALVDLKSWVEKQVAEKGILYGLDGRILHIRQSYAALNTLLQSAGAIICKQWLVIVNRELIKRKLPATQVLWIHDEIQIECKEEVAEEVAAICTESMPKVNEIFTEFKCPLVANAAIGNNWKETH